MKKTFLLLMIFFLALSTHSLMLNRALDDAYLFRKDVLLFFYQSGSDIWHEFSESFFTPVVLKDLTRKNNIVFLRTEKYRNLRYHLNVPDRNTLVILNRFGQEKDRIYIDHVPYENDSLVELIRQVSSSDRNYLELKRKVRRYPDNYFFKFELSKKYLRRKDLKKTELLLIDTISLVPSFIQGYINLARLYRITGNYQEALSVLNLARNIRSGSDRVLLEKVKVYVEAGQYVTAQDIIDLIIPADDIMSYEKMLAQIYIYSMMNKIDKAMETYDILKKEAPGSIYTNYAELFLNENINR
ncbi:MAG: tetratricopeptide repeat protein [Candidatus Muiribacteriaceae bacterium]